MDQRPDKAKDEASNRTKSECAKWPMVISLFLIVMTQAISRFASGYLLDDVLKRFQTTQTVFGFCSSLSFMLLLVSGPPTMWVLPYVNKRSACRNIVSGKPTPPATYVSTCTYSSYCSVTLAAFTVLHGLVTGTIRVKISKLCRMLIAYFLKTFKVASFN